MPAVILYVLSTEVLHKNMCSNNLISDDLSRSKQFRRKVKYHSSSVRNPWRDQIYLHGSKVYVLLVPTYYCTARYIDEYHVMKGVPHMALINMQRYTAVNFPETFIAIRVDYSVSWYYLPTVVRVLYFPHVGYMFPWNLPKSLWQTGLPCSQLLLL